jgi:TetR/AcrR family transcriptional regulator, mexJK operon transcriptional repressor
MQVTPEPARPKRAGRLASGSAIREAAAGLFLEKGYLGTSMDDIAAAARVSKQTIYTHFANKEELFADLVLANAGRVEEFITALTGALGEPDTEAGLGQAARMYVRFVIRPEVLRLRRLIIGEASRFPELARAYHEQVPGRVYAALAGVFATLMGEGRLRAGDPLMAAHHFAWLSLGMPLDRGMFEPNGTVSGGELDRIAEAAVQVFYAAYRP